MDDQDEKFPLERRRAPRIAGHGATAEYSVEGMDPSLKQAFVKDICIYGVCIFVPEELSVGVELFLDIELVADQLEITVKGKVAWQKKGDVSGYYNTGIEFTEVSDENKKILSEFITSNYRGNDQL